MSKQPNDPLAIYRCIDDISVWHTWWLLFCAGPGRGYHLSKPPEIPLRIAAIKLVKLGVAEIVKDHDDHRLFVLKESEFKLSREVRQIWKSFLDRSR